MARSFKKHFLGLSDNVTYFVEQLEARDVNTYQARDVNTYHYRVTFKPQSIVPDYDLRFSGSEAGDLLQGEESRPAQ